MRARHVAIAFLILLALEGLVRAAASAALFREEMIKYRFDYFLCWSSVQALNRGMPDIYGGEKAQFDHALSGGKWSFPDNHPPPYYLLFLPQSAFSFEAGFWVHNTLTTLLYFCGLWMLGRLLLGSDARWAVPLLVLGTLLAGIGMDNLFYGQVDFAAFFLLSCVLIAALRGHEFAAGACLGVAILMKGFPWYLLVYFALERRWRVFIGVAAAAAVFTLAALTLWGLPNFHAYLQHSKGASYYVLLLNQSLMGWFVMHIHGALTLAQVKIVHAALTAGLLGFLAVLHARVPARDPQEVTLEFACFVLAAMLGAAFSWGHHKVMMLFLVIPALSRALGDRMCPGAALVIFGIFLVHWSLEGEAAAEASRLGLWYYRAYGPLLMLAANFAIAVGLRVRRA